MTRKVRVVSASAKKKLSSLFSDDVRELPGTPHVRVRPVAPPPPPPEPVVQDTAPAPAPAPAPAQEPETHEEHDTEYKPLAPSM